MKEKRVFFTEYAYVAGILVLALGTALMERADFGMSMVVAPAYILHLKISQFFPFYTFGMSEYVLQAALLIVLALLMGRFKRGYLFSFVTAVLYGFVLDGFMLLGALLPTGQLWQRGIYYVLGMLFCSAGVSAMFHTYISPEVYELFVKEVSGRFGVNINKFKTGYDCVSSLVGVIMSFLVFGMWHFVGVNWGTILCALINGTIIGRFSAFYEEHWTFCDSFGWRKYFASENGPDDRDSQKEVD